MRKSLVAAAVAVALSDTSALANVACFVEASAAKNITTTKADDSFVGPITIAADGLAGGVGAGCNVYIADVAMSPVIGALVRYDVNEIDTAAFGESIKGQGTWMALGKFGIKPNPSSEIYALAGIAKTELSFADLKTSPNGFVYGAGLELDIGIKNLHHTKWSSHTTLRMGLCG